MPDTVNLELLAKQQAQILTSMNVFREDMNVMMEILRRQDARMEASESKLELRLNGIEVAVHSIGTQLTEMHAFNRRTAERVRVLEEQR